MNRIAIALCLLSFSACVLEENNPPKYDALSQAEAWHAGESPTLFDPNLATEADALPESGEAANIPWAANYWPIYQDSINYRWNGANTLSPAAKYAAAFGVPDLENVVSAQHGVDSFRGSRASCTNSSQCNSSIGEACSFREGNPMGVCIPTWFGICHAWAPVSIMEPEPVSPVTMNGVTFEVNDIKAYLTILHDQVSHRFVSLRCNADDDSGQIQYDEFGRPLERACRDSNPGAFHVLIANYLGLRNESFVYERVLDDEVWNQPLRGYEITENREVSANEANDLLGVTSSGDGSLENQGNYEVQLKNNQWFLVNAFPVAAGDTVIAELSGNGEGNLLIRFNGQPNAQQFDCLSAGPGSNETCSAVAPQAGMAHVAIHETSAFGNHKLSVKIQKQGGIGGGDSYAFNNAAASLRYIEMTVDYIAESPAHLDGNLSTSIDQFTKQDFYQYILELDAAGRIVGGEWVGNSKRKHPDFLWLPTGRTNDSILGGRINYWQVKQLLDLSLSTP